MDYPLILIAAQPIHTKLAERVAAQARIFGPPGFSYKTLVITRTRMWGNGVRRFEYDINLLKEATRVLYVSCAGMSDPFVANVIKHALEGKPGAKFCIVEPFNGPCRQDREDADNHRPALGPQLARMLVHNVGSDVNVTVVTPHSTEFMKDYPATFRDADAIPALIERARRDLPSNARLVLCAVDAGVGKRWPNYKFGIVCNKVRDPATGATITTLPPGQMDALGPDDVLLFLDDELDSGGTMCAAIDLVAAECSSSPPRIVIAVAHASLSGENAITNLVAMRAKYPQFRMYAADTRLDRIEAALAAGLPSDILTVVPVVEDLLVDLATDLARGDAA